jgi:hypothetical protein
MNRLPLSAKSITLIGVALFALYLIVTISLPARFH